MLIYVIIFKTWRFDDFAAMTHDNLSQLRLYSVKISHFIVMEHLYSI